MITVRVAEPANRGLPLSVAIITRLETQQQKKSQSLDILTDYFYADGKEI